MTTKIQSLTALFGMLALHTPEVRAQNVIWSEEFNYNGAPDANTWSYDVGNNNGWGNGELQHYTSNPENVVVDGQALKIIARKEDDDRFTSARIKTDTKFSFTYGTLEARIKPPDMDAGLWPAFWTMGSDLYQVGWPKAGEVDIFEMGQGLAINEGLVNKRVVSAAHWDIFGQYATYARSFDSPVDLTLDYHVYKFEWTPTKMATYVDGNWIWEIDIGDECPSCAELHQPHYLLFSMAVGGGFTSGGSSSSAAGSSSSSGCASSSSAGSSSSSGGCAGRTPEDITAPMPAELLVDWVRLYENEWTQVYTQAPTPSPTVFLRQPETPQPTTKPPIPTPVPTKRPTTPIPIPTPVPTKRPTTPIPVAAPVTQVPVGTRLPVSGGGKAGGKAGGKSGKAGKAGNGLVRQNVSGGKAGKAGSKGVTGVRQGVSGGKAGKGGKGKWNRSGTTATGGVRYNGNGYDGTATGAAPGMSPGYSPGTATTGFTPGSTTTGFTPGATGITPGATMPPTPTGATWFTPGATMPPTPPTTTQMNGVEFEPIEGSDGTESDGTASSAGTESEIFRPAPQSLVARASSGASSQSSFLSIIMAGLVAVGLMTGAATRW